MGAATEILHIPWVDSRAQTGTYSDVGIDPLPAADEDVSKGYEE